jgi:hypothetical protein
MPEVMSIAVTGDDQWLVVNGRPVEYYAADTAFIDGKKVWASERAALRLGEALGSTAEIIDFAEAGFPNAIVTLRNGERRTVDGNGSLEALGLVASDPADIGEDEVIILARELFTKANAAEEAPVQAS